MIVTILIIVGAVVVLVVAGIIVGYFINHETGARASGEHNFRTEGATQVTLPLRTQVHRDVRAAAWDRPWLLPDLPAAAPYRPDRLAVMAARYAPPADLPGPPNMSPSGPLDAVRAGELALPASASPGPVSGGGELAPHVLKALTRAGSEDTVVRMTDLEPMVGGDPLDGHGTVDAYVDWLFAGIKVSA